MTDRAHLKPAGADRIPTTDPVFEGLLAERIARVRRLGVEPHSAHIEAALPLVAAGQWRRAEAVLACVPGNSFGFVCRLRVDCPSCAHRTQLALFHSMLEAARPYASPVTLLATLPGVDLEQTLTALLANLGALRRQVWFRSACVAGVGVIEVPRTIGGHRWNTHLHAVVDLRLAPDAVGAWQVRAEHAWADLAGFGGARLALEPLRDLRAFSLYATKLSAPPPSWAPSRGSLPSTLETELRSALHRRRLLTQWGGARRPKERQP